MSIINEAKKDWNHIIKFEQLKFGIIVGIALKAKKYHENKSDDQHNGN